MVCAVSVLVRIVAYTIQMQGIFKINVCDKMRNNEIKLTTY